MIVLDTHAWIWFVSNPELLSEEAGKAADDAKKKRADICLIHKRVGGRASHCQRAAESHNGCGCLNSKVGNAAVSQVHTCEQHYCCQVGESAAATS